MAQQHDFDRHSSRLFVPPSLDFPSLQLKRLAFSPPAPPQMLVLLTEAKNTTAGSFPGWGLRTSRVWCSTERGKALFWSIMGGVRWHFVPDFESRTIHRDHGIGDPPHQRAKVGPLIDRDVQRNRPTDIPANKDLDSNISPVRNHSALCPTLKGGLMI
jgi:hypothetical protein